VFTSGYGCFPFVDFTGEKGTGKGVNTDFNYSLDTASELKMQIIALLLRANEDIRRYMLP
jgi:hypothetical protein